MTSKENIYSQLKQKAEQIKNEFNETKKIKYDHFRIKHIVRENLKEMIKNYPTINSGEAIKEYIEEPSKENNNLENVDLTKKPQPKKTEEIREINSLEENVILKAKELECQINEINNKRIQLILKDFREQLIDDSEKDFESFQENLNNEFNTTSDTLSQEHSKKLEKIENLCEKINQVEEYLKDLYIELKDEKVDLNSTFDSYLSNLEKEKANITKKYKSDMIKYIDNRVLIFKNSLESKLNKK